MSVSAVLSVLLGCVVLFGALAKILAPGQTRSALATFGVTSTAKRSGIWVTVVASELALGAGLLAGLRVAAMGTAGLMALWTIALALALRSGHRGQRCGCFGARSTVNSMALVRNTLLAGFAVAISVLPSMTPSAQTWLTIGVALALVAVAALAVVVLALAREVGELRLRVAPELALELEGEGPSLGTRLDAIEQFTCHPQAQLAVAVFASDGCALCRALEPSIAQLDRDEFLSLEVFDEVADQHVWAELAIPGSPYAVVMSIDGQALAKGTFNSYGQLQGLIAAADARRQTAHA